jgi:hypothetical protein
VFGMLTFTPESAGRLYPDWSSDMAYDVDEVVCAGTGQLAVRYHTCRRAE